MSEGSTLQSRLRVLVAKAFKAEKLYSSIRNTNPVHPGQANSVSDFANDIRAKEWQNSHFQLRQAINDILSQASSASVARHVAQLRDRFEHITAESLKVVQSGGKNIVDSAQREEFGQLLKQTFELIRHKARAEASKIIANELTAALGASGKATSAQDENDTLFASAFSAEASASQPASTVVEEESIPSNVIQLHRRRAQGGGRR